MTHTYTLADFEALKEILARNQQSIAIRKAFGALNLILSHPPISPDSIKKYVFFDDCPEYTGSGFNSGLLTTNYSTLSKIDLCKTGHLGKAIILWRLTIKK
jgi:hypothetical protein